MEREKGINRSIIVQAIEESLHIAATKGDDAPTEVSISINPRTGDIEAQCVKEIVEEVVIPGEEITLPAALELNPDAEIGSFIHVPLDPTLMGRIAAQQAKQVITQKLRMAEKDVIYEEYRHRVNELISGSVKRVIRGTVIIDLGKVEALMPLRHYPKTERYNVGDRVLALLCEVQETDAGGAEVILSRTDSEFVRQLFLQEVPEIHDGLVTIGSIVREPGFRTKLTVSSSDSRVDPVGACIGMRGIRVKNIVRELNNEKIDVIPFSDDPVELLQNALAPIEIRKLGISEEEEEVSIVVDDDDLATVIGKKGINARLTGKLVGMELEVQRISEYNRAMSLQRMQIAESDDESLDTPLQIDGVSALITANIIDAGFDTPRKVLLASIEELCTIPGISADLADTILEKIRKTKV
jgi:N utilization substance protein A